jgi:hypothetical protein
MWRAVFSVSLAVLAVALGLFATIRARAAVNRASTYRLDSYALQLNGDTQYVNGLDGGFVDGVVVTENGGPMPKKHIGNAKIEPVRARVRVDQFTQFLSDSLAGKGENGSGTIYYIDNGGTVQQQRTLSGLTLSELAFPGCSGSQKTGNALLMTMTLAAESSKAVEPLAGATPPIKADTGAASKAKQWAGNFRFQVPGLPTNRVSVIEPFTIRRKAASDAGGTTKEPGLKPVVWEIPNLVFYMTPQDSLAWIAWHDDFVVQEHNSDAQEKTFTLELLSPDMKSTILQLDGSGVGIVSAKYEQSLSANAPVSQGFRVELYVESLKLTANGSAPATKP